MIRIKVPATSANLGPGFDVLGIAFTLYNAFKFEESERFYMVGFEKRYSNPKYNLVCRSYCKVFEYLNISPIPVKIYMDVQEVPTSRGLGSSATCIVAGVMAAKYYLGEKITLDECFQIASNIEGHPDNIAPAMFGGLVSSYKVEDKFKFVRYNVSNKLKFNVLVPPFELNTHAARKVLPKVLNYKDILYNTARISNLPYAFSEGNIELLKELMDDKMHEPYRMELIKDADKIKEIAHKNDCAFAISGAGPSLLIVSDKESLDCFNDFKDWSIFNLSTGSAGAIIEEI